MSFFKTLIYSFIPQNVMLASMKADQDRALKHQQKRQEEYEEWEDEYEDEYAREDD